MIKIITYSDVGYLYIYRIEKKYWKTTLEISSVRVKMLNVMTEETFTWLIQIFCGWSFIAKTFLVLLFQLSLFFHLRFSA